jgi:hypothetical protein
MGTSTPRQEPETVLIGDHEFDGGSNFAVSDLTPVLGAGDTAAARNELEVDRNASDR